MPLSAPSSPSRKPSSASWRSWWKRNLKAPCRPLSPPSATGSSSAMPKLRKSAGLLKDRGADRGSLICKAGEYEHHRRLAGAGHNRCAAGVPEGTQMDAVPAVGNGGAEIALSLLHGKRPEPDSQHSAAEAGDCVHGSTGTAGQWGNPEFHGKRGSGKKSCCPGQRGDSGCRWKCGSGKGLEPLQRRPRAGLAVCAVPALGGGRGADGAVRTCQLSAAAPPGGHRHPHGEEYQAQ